MNLNCDRGSLKDFHEIEKLSEGHFSIRFRFFRIGGRHRFVFGLWSFRHFLLLGLFDDCFVVVI